MGRDGEDGVDVDVYIVVGLGRHLVAHVVLVSVSSIPPPGVDFSSNPNEARSSVKCNPSVPALVLGAVVPGYSFDAAVVRVARVGCPGSVTFVRRPSVSIARAFALRLTTTTTITIPGQRVHASSPFSKSHAQRPWTFLYLVREAKHASQGKCKKEG